MSVLWRENPWYRACEHIFVGTTAAYNVVTTFSGTIKPGVTENMVRNGDWWEIIPICLGLMIYMQPIPSLRWISRFPTAYWIGYNAGMNLTIRIFMPLFTEITASMRPLIVVNEGSFNLMASVTNTVFTVNMLLAFLYFFFSFEFISRSKRVLTGARWVIMVAFGAAFGTSVMARISLFLGRAEFLLVNWLKILPS